MQYEPYCILGQTDIGEKLLVIRDGFCPTLNYLNVGVLIFI